MMSQHVKMILIQIEGILWYFYFSQSYCLILHCKYCWYSSSFTGFTTAIIWFKILQLINQHVETIVKEVIFMSILLTELWVIAYLYEKGALVSIGKVYFCTPAVSVTESGDSLCKSHIVCVFFKLKYDINLV